MFYISASLNLWSTLQGLKWGLMKHNAFYDLGSVALGLVFFFCKWTGDTTTRAYFKKCPTVCVVR